MTVVCAYTLQMYRASVLICRKAEAGYGPKEDAMFAKENPSSREQGETIITHNKITHQLKTFSLGTTSQGNQGDWWFDTCESRALISKIPNTDLLPS